ncbi:MULTISPECIES: hypothetical protein [Ensifer]|uniref:hypothetical protein n=1 Tax=Ensifer TaxID=106591 RepID=UPI0012E3D8FA|nr:MULTISPECIES: hypothetical protein [Ensifer]MDF8354873.1 hypothetical protein [Ensifer adhaerens]
MAKKFQEKCETVFRQELRHLAKQFQEKCAAVFRPELRHLAKKFQEKCAAVFRPELRETVLSSPVFQRAGQPVAPRRAADQNGLT